MIDNVHELYWKLVCRLDAIPIQVTAHFVFVEVGKIIIKFTWKCKGLRTARPSLRKRKKK